MAGDPVYRDMGPAQLTWLPRSGPYAGNTVTIPFTFGGVKYSETEEKADIKYDQTGTVPADRMSQGHMADIVCPIAKADADLIVQIDPATTLVVDMSDPDKAYLESHYRTGQLDSEILGELILTFIIDGVPSDDPEETLHFPAAAPRVNLDMQWNAETQRAYALTFHAYPDFRRADAAFKILGDPTATPA